MMRIPSQHGFTLVETLVAIAILLLSISGPLYSVNKALTASYIARDQLIASSLAQEGMEYIRTTRDNNYLYNYANPGSPRNWLYGLDNCRTTNTCTVDPTGNTPITLCGGTCPVLYNSATGLYTQTSTSNTPTRFTRSVTVRDVSANEVRVTVTVSWVTNRVTYSVVINDNLMNWL